jgi:hypothetical protein
MDFIPCVQHRNADGHLQRRCHYELETAMRYQAQERPAIIADSIAADRGHAISLDGPSTSTLIVQQIANQEFKFTSSESPTAFSFHNVI